MGVTKHGVDCVFPTRLTHFDQDLVKGFSISNLLNYFNSFTTEERIFIWTFHPIEDVK